MMKFQSIRGTRDVLPAEAASWQFVEKKLRDIFTVYNYQEIRTPLFEQTELFSRGIGELTDIVSKEMYTFLDRGKKSLTLKPEMTAPVLRSYIENNLGEKTPLSKLYYITPAFRQENPQAGRLRQFHQFGAEAIGSPFPQMDAEIILLSFHIYQQFDLQNISLKLNSVGDAKCRPPYKEKLRNALKSTIRTFCEDCQRRYETNPIRILDCKADQDKIEKLELPFISDHLCDECKVHFEKLTTYLQRLKIPFDNNKKLVRGLDYYTRTAYEIVSSDLGAQNALGGGGRYDLLAEQLGGKSTPAVGYAGGIERLIMVLENQKKFPEDQPSVDIYFAALGEQATNWALEVAQQLRLSGWRIEVEMLQRSLKAQMREANRLKAKYVVMAGDEEIQHQKAIVKNMGTSEQTSIPFGEVIPYFQKSLPR